MNQIALSEFYQYFSQCDWKPDPHEKVWLVNLSWDLISNKDSEQMGLPGTIAHDVSFNVSFGWGGWGFYTLNNYKKNTVISAIPVLLLQDQFDAFIFRLKYPGAGWIPTINTDKEKYNVEYS
ncbi:hypothetical protein N9V27_01070 [bacterium]|jgi:hypothetical protein|nr:hypothetical protein [bacterium]|tara:strand:- start:225 stop:590 length:366 start_codon:yes stop_codon:yes gene_type:complete